MRMHIVYIENIYGVLCTLYHDYFNKFRVYGDCDILLPIFGFLRYGV